jgi:cellulose synthase/poly-beta-1,6-N-acetylglucosamine synthase-like glycosyltransferase
MNVLSEVFQWLLLFVGLYIVLAVGAWIASAARFALARETRGAEDFYDIPDAGLPSITVHLPAYREEPTIGAALDALRDVDYRDLQVTAIDDGSPGGAADVIATHLPTDPRLGCTGRR